MHLRFAFIPVFIALGSINAHGQLNPLAENAGARVVFERALSAESRAEWEVLIGLGIKAGGYGASDASAISRMMLVRWLTERWIAEAGAPDRQALVNAISRGNRRYLYVYNASDDTYRRDSAGDLKIRGIAGYKGPGGDKEAWLEDVGTAKEAALASWRKRTKAVYLELLASEGIDEGGEIAKAFSASIAEYEAGVERDFHELTVRHELRLSHLRLRDTLSARRKGESQSAGEVADKLVGAARKSLQASTESLEASIPESEDAAAIKVNAEDWQESFRRQFETGLEAWSNAEDRFVAERLKWETDAQKAYISAEEDWDQAFKDFEKERRDWFARMNRLLVTAGRSWNKTIKSFEADIKRELSSLKAAQQKEQAARQQEASTYLETFKQASGVLSMAEESIAYLKQREGHLKERREKAVQNIINARNMIESLRQPEYEAQRNIETWQEREAEMRIKIGRSGENWHDYYYTKSSDDDDDDGEDTTVTYYGVHVGGIKYEQMTYKEALASVLGSLEAAKQGKAAAIRSAKVYIETQKGYIIKEKKSVENSDIILIQEELVHWEGQDGTGGIKAQFTRIREEAKSRILGFVSRVSEGMAGTNSTEMEKDRLTKLIAMLQQEKSIAEAVKNYAEDTSSNRATRAQTAESLKAAEGNMLQAQRAYQASIGTLKSLLNGAVTGKQQALNTKQGELARLRGSLSQAKQELQRAMGAYRLNDVGVFDRLLDNIDKDVKAFLNKGEKPGSEENKAGYQSLMNAYFGPSWQMAITNYFRRIQPVEALLTDGDEEKVLPVKSQIKITAYRDGLKSIKLTGFSSAEEFRNNLLSTDGITAKDKIVSVLATAYKAVLDADEDIPARAHAELILQTLYKNALLFAEYEVKLRRNQLDIVSGRYKQDGTLHSDKNASPIVLDKEGAEKLKEEFRLSAARAKLAYRKELLSKQLDVNLALKTAEEEKDEWITSLQDELTRASTNLTNLINNKADQTLIDAAQTDKTQAAAALRRARTAKSPGEELIKRLNARFDENKPEDKLALTLYLNGKRTLKETESDKVRNVLGSLNKADLTSAESIEKALKDNTNPHSLQFRLQGTNLLDNLAADKRRSYDAARARVDALKQYGRFGYTSLEERLKDYIKNIKDAVKGFTDKAQTASNPAGKKGAVNPGVFAEAYSKLMTLGAPSSITETLGMYAAALAAEGRLTALNDRQIAGISDEKLAAAHRHLAVLLAAPAKGVPLSSLAGNNLPKGTAQPNVLKADFYKEMLQAAIDTVILPDFRSQDVVKGYTNRVENISEEVNNLGELRRAFINAESAYRSNLAQRITVGVEREAFIKNKADFRSNNIKPLEDRIDSLQERVPGLENGIKDALADFVKAVKDYEEQGDKVKRDEESYQAARLRLRTAEAVNDYARSGAVDSAPDPDTALENIKKELAAAKNARRIITNLINRNAKNPVRDAEFKKLLRTESGQLQAVQELTLAKEKLEADVNKLEVNIHLTEKTIKDFLISKAYYPESAEDKDKKGARKLKKDELDELDLNKVSFEIFRKRKANFSQYSDYFEKNDKTQYAADLAGWILGIKDYGEKHSGGANEFLRKMAVAIMYELNMAEGYQNHLREPYTEITTTDDDGNETTEYRPGPYHYFQYATPSELRSYDLSPFRDAGNGVHSKLKPTALDTVQARNLIKVSRLRFFGLAIGNRYSRQEAMERMLSSAASEYNAVKNTPEYHFFRLLMTIAVKDGRDPLTLRANIADSAIQDHIIAVMKMNAASFRSYLDPFWYPKERASIMNAINNMPNHGHMRKIDKFLEKGKLTEDVNTWRKDTESLKKLTEKEPTFASVREAITSREGKFNKEVEKVVRHQLRKVIAEGKGGIVSVVAGAQQRIINEVARTGKSLERRARALNRKARTLEQQYNNVLSRFLEGRATEEELTAAASERYRNLGFDPVDYLSRRTDNVNQVKTYNNKGEAAKLSKLIKRTLAQAVHVDKAAHRKVQHSYDMDRRQLYRGLKDRQAEITSLINLAKNEWNTSRTRLEGIRIRWRQDSKELYKESSELWNLRHAQLAAGREKWLEESTRAGMAAASRAVAQQWDLEAETRIADAESAVIPAIKVNTPDLSRLVKEAAGGTVLDALIERASQMRPRGSRKTMVVAAYLPSLNVNAAKASAARSITQALFDQVTERAAVLTAIRARDQFDKQLEGLEKGIDDANRNVEDMLINQMGAAGYQRYGTIWRRQSIIGSTLFGGEEWESQQVVTYRRFTSPGFHAQTDLSDENIKGLSGAEIFNLVEKAGEEMMRYQVMIFGRSEDQRSEKTKEGKKNKKYVKPADAQEFHSVLSNILKIARKSWKNSAGASRNADTEGLFNFHVGYRPVMKGENIKEAGYGQMGIIMSQFMKNEARLHRGHAALMTPDYRKPMWDDDADNDGKSDGIIAAPSLATVVDIAANIIIAAVLPPGLGNVLLGAALNLVDDLIFTTADVSTGYRSSQEAFGALGVKALTSAATAATGGLLNGFGTAVEGSKGFLVSGLRGMVKTSNTFAKAGVNAGFAATTAAVNKVMSQGIHVVANNGKWEDFAEGFDRLDDWAGVAASGMQAGFGSLAGDFFTTDGTNLVLDNNTFNTSALQGAASLTGSFSGALTEYAMSGKTTLNLLNMSMFNLKGVGDTTVSGGLLELNIGGGRNLFSIGQGGYNANIGTIANTIAGFGEIDRIARAKVAGKGSHALGLLNTVNYQSWGGDYGLAEDLWKGRIKLAFEDLGETAYGLYRHRETPDTIVLNQRYNTNDREDAAVLASAGSHEGRHLYDRRYHGYTTEAGAHSSGKRTYDILKYRLNLKGNAELINTINAALDDPRSSMPNQGDVDYWKLKSDGSIEWDGKRGLYDEQGNLIRLAVDENGLPLGYGESLLEYMGRKNAEAFLKFRGLTTAGDMTNSELGDELMSHTALKWSAEGVPKDPNMAESLNSGNRYTTMRDSWISTSYKHYSGNEQKLRLRFGTATPRFIASKDVMKQVAMRDSIISDMAVYANAVKGRYISPASLSGLATDIRKRQGQYNQRYVKSILSFTPENYVSQKFANNASRLALTNGLYLTYRHAGIDTVGSDRVVSPGFTERFAIPNWAKKSHAFELSLIGTDINFRGLHMNPDQMKQIPVGMQFTPGRLIGNYGEWGGITGPHLHGEATRVNGKGERGFVNGATLGIDSWRPGSDFAGYYEYKENDKYIINEKIRWFQIWPR